MQVVVGAAVAGAVYAGISYFGKDKDVKDSFNRFGSNVESDARGRTFLVHVLSLNSCFTVKPVVSLNMPCC